MWVTTHPFAQGDWNDLTTPSQIKKALTKDVSALCGTEVDDDTVKTVSDRLWLLVLRDKQGSLMLSPAELSQVESVLNRKGKK